VGENGSGKSTLLEGIAVAAGLNPEGGSRNLIFSTRSTESDLHNHLRLGWNRRPKRAFFLRAETFYDTATAYETLPLDPITGYHERSHGESFLDVASKHFLPEGLYLMDEPESALSLTGQLKLMRRMHDLIGSGSQFLVATHSPLLLAFPSATIYVLDDQITRATYEETEVYQLTKSFLESPQRFLKYLFTDDEV